MADGIKLVEFPEMRQIRLNIGCGDKKVPGYIGIDIVDRGQEIIADIRNIPLLDNYADEILSVHVIEHVYQWEAAPLLKEWLRILKPGGKMVIECPNLLRVLHHALETGEIGGPMFWWPIYGDPGHKDPLMCHKWGYVPDSLIALMKSVGLTDVKQETALFKAGEKRDMRVTGVKLAH